MSNTKIDTVNIPDCLSVFGVRWRLRGLTLICIVGVAVLLTRPVVRAQGQATVTLDGFENGIRVAAPNETNPQYRFLWNQYPGDPTEGPDPGVATVVTSPVRQGSNSLQVRITGGNLYLQFYPNNGATWENLKKWVQPAAAWTDNTFNRMRIWVRFPQQIEAEPNNGRYNLSLGTYVRRRNGDAYNPEEGGGHFYHNYNIGYSGQWHQVIVDTHPNFRRGGDPTIDIGDKEHFSGDSGWNYFDGMTRFYLDIQGGITGSYPADFYIDGIELYRETRPVNIQQVYSLNSVYIPGQNKLHIGWQRKVEENSVKHEVRYAFQDIFSLGWANATPAPDGIITPPGWTGYNAMEYSTTGINVSGRSVVYFAIKPQNSSSFNQIAVPITAGGPTTNLPSAPRNLRIIPGF